MPKILKQNNKINKLYIANRGEIALRIQRSAKRLGIKCCIGISEADQELSFARLAEETIVIGPAQASLSYLSIERVIAAALKAKCNAVHPGYGFLSESHEFAKAVVDAGLIWVGPSPESIRLMGSKIEGRKRAIEAKVPVVPGAQALLDDTALLKEAKKIGFPLIIKAVGGGGGRGMRIVKNKEELVELLPRARGEALKNFGNQEIFLERFLESPRHIEVQLLGDMHGNLIHLGTRECSTQRRHQKLIEEAPAPFLTTKIREQIHQAALAVAKSVSYYSAGTAEFLLDGRKFYFLEMNTRIQVEHPVTESITGLDLIEQQLKVAQGERLTLSQKKIKFKGHAIEFRINAEDARDNFNPTTGEITLLTLPQVVPGEVRNDFGFMQGDNVSMFYDGLMGKIIVSGNSRKAALQRAVLALAEFKCQGLATNLEFHRWLIRTRIFNEQGIDISFISREFSPDCLDDLVAAELRDPESGKRGDSRVSFPTKGRGKHKQVVIEVNERPDGTFLATRRSPQAKIASNSKEMAIQGLLTP